VENSTPHLVVDVGATQPPTLEQSFELDGRRVRK